MYGNYCSSTTYCKNFGINNLDVLKAIAVAAAFHDFVFVSGDKKNEENSAEKANEFAGKNGLTDYANHIQAAILGTRFVFKEGEKPYQDFMIEEERNNTLQKLDLLDDKNTLLIMLCVGLADLGVYAFSLDTNTNSQTLVHVAQLYSKELDKKFNDDFKDFQREFFRHIQKRITDMNNQSQILNISEMKGVLDELSKRYGRISDFWSSYTLDPAT